MNNGWGSGDAPHGESFFLDMKTRDSDCGRWQNESHWMEAPEKQEDW